MACHFLFRGQRQDRSGKSSSSLPGCRAAKYSLTVKGNILTPLKDQNCPRSMSSCDVDADFSGADLSNADVESVDFEGANLTGAVLSGAQVTGIFPFLENTSAQVSISV